MLRPPPPATFRGGAGIAAAAGSCQVCQREENKNKGEKEISPQGGKVLGKEERVEQCFPNCTSPESPGQGLAQAWDDRNEQGKCLELGGVSSTAKGESRGVCSRREGGKRGEGREEDRKGGREGGREKGR